MKHLYFVRHGLSEMNSLGVFAGRTETDLLPEGIYQASHIDQKIKSYHIDCIVASPLKRTRQTAELIAESINFPVNEIIYNNLLIERDFGPLEGKKYIPNLQDYPGVESIEDLIIRAGKALDFLKNLPTENILVVSHGAIGRALRHCADNRIPFYPSKKFDNCELVQLI